MIGTGLAVASTLASLWGGERANVASAREAQRNRNFQERMSSTSHQREVKDLRLAGLNPILSATKGASTPGGSMAVQKDIATPAVHSGLSAKLQHAQLENINMDTNKKMHETAKIDTDRQNNISTNQLLEQTHRTKKWEEYYNQSLLNGAKTADQILQDIKQQINSESVNSAYNALDSLPNQPLLKQYKGLDSATMKRKSKINSKRKTKRKN